MCGLYMYDVVVKKFVFAISSPDEFLYICSVSLGHASDICRVERNVGPSEANRLFVEKMLKSDGVGWFREFVTALENAGMYFACV